MNFTSHAFPEGEPVVAGETLEACLHAIFSFQYPAAAYGSMVACSPWSGLNTRKTEDEKRL